MKARHLLIALALLVAFASDLWGQSQEPPPQIETEQKANEAQPGKPETPEQNSSVQAAPVGTPSPSADHGDQKPAAEAHKTSEETSEGTEYWVYRGYKVKITDGLLALFTLGLVIIGIFQAAFLKGALQATAVAATAADLSARAAISATVVVALAHRSYAHWKPRIEASDPRQRQVHAAMFTFAEAQSEFSA
jgi:hypothetical protein